MNFILTITPTDFGWRLDDNRTFKKITARYFSLSLSNLVINVSLSLLFLPLLSLPAFAQLSNKRLSLSLSLFQDRGGREGGVVAATSRDTITQHI